MGMLFFTRMFSDVKEPRLGTNHSVGADIHAYIKTESGRPSKVMIPAKATRAINTGLVVKSSQGILEGNTAIFVCSRSGMAKEKSIFVTNSPGVIDPDYRGEVLVLLYNGGHEAQYIEDGDRVAQLLVMPVTTPMIVESEMDMREDVTTRGDAGFGSTGR